MEFNLWTISMLNFSTKMEQDSIFVIFAYFLIQIICGEYFVTDKYPENALFFLM